MITDKDIKRAKAFAKVYARIHAPLKVKPLTAEVILRRAKRASKLWAQIFGFAARPARKKNISEVLTNS